jgi:hypothetical protein
LQEAIKQFAGIMPSRPATNKPAVQAKFPDPKKLWSPKTYRAILAHQQIVLMSSKEQSKHSDKKLPPISSFADAVENNIHNHNMRISADSFVADAFDETQVDLEDENITKTQSDENFDQLGLTVHAADTDDRDTGREGDESNKWLSDIAEYGSCKDIEWENVMLGYDASGSYLKEDEEDEHEESLELPSTHHPQTTKEKDLSPDKPPLDEAKEKSPRVDGPNELITTDHIAQSISAIATNTSNMPELSQFLDTNDDSSSFLLKEANEKLPDIAPDRANTSTYEEASANEYEPVDVKEDLDVVIYDSAIITDDSHLDHGEVNSISNDVDHDAELQLSSQFMFETEQSAFQLPVHAALCKDENKSEVKQQLDISDQVDNVEDIDKELLHEPEERPLDAEEVSEIESCKRIESSSENPLNQITDDNINENGVDHQNDHYDPLSNFFETDLQATLLPEATTKADISFEIKAFDENHELVELAPDFAQVLPADQGNRSSQLINNSDTYNHVELAPEHTVEITHDLSDTAASIQKDPSSSSGENLAVEESNYPALTPRNLQSNQQEFASAIVSNPLIRLPDPAAMINPSSRYASISSLGQGTTVSGVVDESDNGLRDQDNQPYVSSYFDIRSQITHTDSLKSLTSSYKEQSVVFINIDGHEEQSSVDHDQRNLIGYETESQTQDLHEKSVFENRDGFNESVAESSVGSLEHGTMQRAQSDNTYSGSLYTALTAAERSTTEGSNEKSEHTDKYHEGSVDDGVTEEENLASTVVDQSPVDSHGDDRSLASGSSYSSIGSYSTMQGQPRFLAQHPRNHSLSSIESDLTFASQSVFSQDESSFTLSPGNRISHPIGRTQDHSRRCMSQSSMTTGQGCQSNRRRLSSSSIRSLESFSEVSVTASYKESPARKPMNRRRSDHTARSAASMSSGLVSIGVHHRGKADDHTGNESDVDDDISESFAAIPTAAAGAGYKAAKSRQHHHQHHHYHHK